MRMSYFAISARHFKSIKWTKGYHNAGQGTYSISRIMGFKILNTYSNNLAIINAPGK